MLTRWIFLILVILLGGQRLAELRLSARHDRRILALGGREHAPGQFRVMRWMHIAWFFAMLAEVFSLQRPFQPALALVASLGFLAGQALRYAAIHTLGERWTVRVMTLPGAKPVSQGIYRFIRHPNYLGVMLEIAAVPLLHSAYLTAIFFSIANALVLAWRIRTEETALKEQNNYEQAFAGRPRFLPRL
ncbi:MAG TPA: isoprenylcysteine carboxylmethyltransferase family protein [Anaerolineales bacterium]|nr:isoprenylcysteine carboxylmethyltransferase family protein [Anaerolineales bacterium]